MQTGGNLWGMGAMVVAMCLSVVVSPAVSNASDAGSDQDQPLEETGERLEVSRSGLVAWKPDGWVRIEPPSGAVLTLLAAGRDQIRLELRAETGLDKKDKKQFFSSFHAKLLATGFQRLERRENVRYGSYSGPQTTYKVSSDKTPYQLVIWQVGHGETAWMVVGFFPEARIEHFMSTYRRFAGALQLEDATNPEGKDDEVEAGSGRHEGSTSGDDP